MTQQEITQHDRPPQVVIVGGGFGGLYAARALRDAPCDVTLVDRTPQHVFQPLLYQCATGILSEGQITAPLRRLFRKHHNLECISAEAVNVDAARRRLICIRPLGEAIEVPYDHLIVAVGLRQSYFGHDEFAEWAPGMKTISDALTIRRRVLGAFEMAETAANPAEQQQWLTFALVGAGPTGVELAGQIRELATKTLRAEYRRVQPEDARVVLFDGGAAPLASFGPQLSRQATRTLRELGVELRMDSIVTSVDGDGLRARAKDGTESRLDAATVLWTAGVEAPPIAAALAAATGVHQDRSGRIPVQDDLTIAGHPEISVVGDLMTLRKLPGLAEVAMQSGHYAGHRVKRLLTGQAEEKPFKYRDLGSAAYISRGRAVVSACGCTCGASPAGSPGCSFTSRSSPGTATGSAPSSPGGSPSPATYGGSAPTPLAGSGASRTCTTRPRLKKRRPPPPRPRRCRRRDARCRAPATDPGGSGPELAYARTVRFVAGQRSGRIELAALLRVLGIASAELAACWQLTAHAPAGSAGLLALAAVALTGAAIVLLTRSGWLPALTAGPLLRRANALRRKSWGAAFQRQLDPDAAGRARPRAPSAVPAAA